MKTAARKAGWGAVSGKWLMEDQELERWFTPEQRRIMREAVEDHRASRQEPPRNLYGRIVSEADRDLDPERIVRPQKDRPGEMEDRDPPPDQKGVSGLPPVPAL